MGIIIILFEKWIYLEFKFEMVEGGFLDKLNKYKIDKNKLIMILKWRVWFWGSNIWRYDL